jgi:hypothetical protein
VLYTTNIEKTKKTICVKNEIWMAYKPLLLPFLSLVVSVLDMELSYQLIPFKREREIHGREQLVEEGALVEGGSNCRGGCTCKERQTC